MRSIFVSSRQTETAQHVHLCVTLVQIWLWNVASLTPTAGMNVRNVAYFKNQMLFSLLAWHTVTVRPLHLLIIIVFVGPVLTSDSFNVQVYSRKSFIMEVRELDSSKQLCALKTVRSDVWDLHLGEFLLSPRLFLQLHWRFSSPGLLWSPSTRQVKAVPGAAEWKWLFKGERHELS